MGSRDEGSRELWTREACADELGVRWDDFGDAMKGDDGNAGFGAVCCVDREEEGTHGKGGRFTVMEA
jgi:hypothetical protein